MSKDGDFLDLDFLENQVVRKDNNKNPSREVASPAARMVSDSKRDSILGRTMKRRDDRRDLEKKISELEGQLKVSQNSLVLDMPVSKVRVKFTKTLVDPEEIDISPENQRVQELLDKESVRDIYESILNEGQAEPGFLRRKPNGRYELISGSRRLYCVKQIEDRQYLALVGDIPDVDVRRLSRLENQQSPISVYERSLSFKHDVDGKRVKSWDALAALEGMSQRQIMKYKALSELPVEIVRSFPSPSDLSLVFSDWIISKIRSSDAVKQRFIEIAMGLINDKERWAEENRSRTATDVMAIYKSSMRIRSESPTRKKALVYKSPKGSSVVKHTISNKGTHKLEFVDLPEPKLEKLIQSLMRDLGLELSNET